MPAYNPSIPIYPKGHLFGMTLTNNGSDATNDIDFAAGQCVDSTGVAFMVGSALTKQLDAAWAAGTNAGGKMSAAAITNTTYHCFAIRKDSDGSVDYGFDVSATAPTMPTGYTYFRRIGSIIRASNAILGFKQKGDTFWLDAPILDVDVNTSGSAAVTRTLSVPIGVVVEWIGHLRAITTAGNQINVSPLDSTDAASTGSNFWMTLGASQTDNMALRVFTNTSGQIRTRENNGVAADTVQLRTRGWVDTRGQYA